MFILQRIPTEIFFYMKILCKFFPNFQTWIGFFSTFFLQNQKTRKLCTFIYLELQLSQFSAKSAKKKNLPKFQKLNRIFLRFFLQNHKTRKLRYLTFDALHVCQVSGKQKKWPRHVGIFEPKFPKFHQNFPIFNLKSIFFRIFQKKPRIFENCEI